jgi:hypothetical protein
MAIEQGRHSDKRFEDEGNGTGLFPVGFGWDGEKTADGPYARDIAVGHQVCAYDGGKLWKSDGGLFGETGTHDVVTVGFHHTVGWDGNPVVAFTVKVPEIAGDFLDRSGHERSPHTGE